MTLSPQVSQEVGFLVIADKHPVIILVSDLEVDKKNTTFLLLLISLKLTISEAESDREIEKIHIKMLYFIKNHCGS